MIFEVKHFDQLSNRELYEILKARCAVFSVEQKMNCQDLDDLDYECFHFYLHEQGKVVAYFRAHFVDEGRRYIKIGRCLTTIRGKGWGAEVMNNGLWYLNKVYEPKKIIIHAQTHAIGFYEKFDFKVTSEEFLEEGIPHVVMERRR